MANEEHVAIVKQGAEAIENYLAENPDVEFDLIGADLIDADLSGADLGGADLCGADLSRANLGATHLINANLSEASLSGANLTSANLCWAHLSDADLRWANLRWAHFSDANLRGADLRGTDLRGADLDANLSEANLSGAILIDANLSGAKLRGADLSEASCRSTSLADVDLSDVKGLDTVQHHGPSTIGVDTLYKSRGKIPEVFLRGCGVPEPLITYLPDLIGAMAPIQFYSCFISYSHADKPFAQRLHNDLQAQGIRCWLDEHEMLPGDNVYAAVDRGIRLWDKVLLCASKDALTSWWVDKEITHAFAKEKELFKQRGQEVLALIPLNLDGHILDEWEHPKKNLVLERLAADFTGWKNDGDKYAHQFDRLVKALRADDRAREKPPEPKL